MAIEKITHYAGTEPLQNSFYRDGKLFAYPLTGSEGPKAVTRTVNFKKNPSMHKCEARCLNASGVNCECECGGVNHGIGG